MSRNPADSQASPAPGLSPQPDAKNAGNPSPTVRRPLGFFRLRKPLGMFASIALGLACVGLCYLVWWLATYGPVGEERWISPTSLPSPAETFQTFPALWSERNLPSNIWVTLRRLVIGFGLAAVVGIPIGVLAGCFPPVQSFLTPLILFGRNIPIAALIPLTFIFFGIAETQKVMFIFFACVAFIISDAASNIASVSQQYIDTAYTLGAKRRHVIAKVLVPLAMPAIFDSLRLLFGLAFGYIMLAETVKLGGEEGGLGNLILMSQRRNIPAHIYLIILIIPIVALALDRCLYFVQRQLFPHRYGGAGLLKKAAAFAIQGWQSLKGSLVPPTPEIASIVAEQLQVIASLDLKAKSYEIEHLSEEAQKQWRP